MDRPEAVVIVTAADPLRILSSAVYGGGLASARAIVNLHVGMTIRAPTRRRCSRPTRAAPERARAVCRPPHRGVDRARDGGRGERRGYPHAGRGHGRLEQSRRRRTGAREPAGSHGTINTIVVVDADPEPAALVNAVITVTEVKALLLHEAGVRDVAGRAVSGTSTDAIVVAATGRGPRVQFGGPVSELGWSIARAAGSALDAGIKGWLERNR